ncbi:MAG: hypothetical protein IPK21_13835 [Haliscomenobacter sp.]|nr:hypothetical protein [Haliscomenobacter sp.]
MPGIQPTHLPQMLRSGLVASAAWRSGEMPVWNASGSVGPLTPPKEGERQRGEAETFPFAWNTTHALAPDASVWTGNLLILAPGGNACMESIGQRWGLPQPSEGGGTPAGRSRNVPFARNTTHARAPGASG